MSKQTITVQREDFERALKVAQAAAESSAVNQLLSCALILSTKDGASVVGTDLMTTVRVNIKAECSGKVAVAVNVTEMLRVVHVFPAGPLVLTIDDKAMSGVLTPAHRTSDRYAFQALPGADFPKVPVPKGAMYAIDGKWLRRILSATKVASARSERPVIEGVKLEAKDGKLTAVATDGHRCHVAAMPFPDVEGFEAMLKPKSVEAILRMLGDEAFYAFEEGRLHLASSAGVELSAHSQDQSGNSAFPPWRQIIPAVGNVTWVDAAELASALERVALVSGGVTGTKVGINGDSLTMRATAEGREMDAVVTLPGDHSLRLALAINAKYVLEAIHSLGTEEVGLQNCDALAPFPLWTREGTGQAVVMPMRE